MPKMCALIVIAMLASGAVQMNNTAYADNSPISGRDVLNQAVELYENLQQDEIDVPAEMSDTGLEQSFLKAVVMGYANLDDAESIESVSEITKQDFMSILYKTIINYDLSYAISAEEADAILNECYDNAYINDENREAYAFMMKQGIISANHGTNPDKVLTWDSCEILTQLVRDYFIQDTVITVGQHDITIGSNVESLLEDMGEPNRIEAAYALCSRTAEALNMTISKAAVILPKRKITRI
jgi:hypothetical protein